MTDDYVRVAITEVSEAQAQGKPEGIIVYGSYAHGRSDEFSDVDLLIVCSTLRDQRQQITKNGVRFDCDFVSLQTLQRAISPLQWRNNHLLFACCTGSAFSPVTDCVKAILVEAVQLHSVGTGPNNRFVERLWQDKVDSLSAIVHKLMNRSAEVFSLDEQQIIDERQLCWAFERLCECFVRLSCRFWYPLWVLGKLPADPFYMELRHKQIDFFASRSRRAREGLLEGLMRQISDVTLLN